MVERIDETNISARVNVMPISGKGFKKKPLAPYKNVIRRRATAADKMYEELVGNGWTKKDAAKQAQDKTGISVVTGMPMKSRGYGR